MWVLRFLFAFFFYMVIVLRSWNLISIHMFFQGLKSMKGQWSGRYWTLRTYPSLIHYQKVCLVLFSLYIYSYVYILWTLYMTMNSEEYIRSLLCTYTYTYTVQSSNAIYENNILKYCFKQTISWDYYFLFLIRLTGADRVIGSDIEIPKVMSSMFGSIKRIYDFLEYISFWFGVNYLFDSRSMLSPSVYISMYESLFDGFNMLQLKNWRSKRFLCSM